MDPRPIENLLMRCFRLHQEVEALMHVYGQKNFNLVKTVSSLRDEIASAARLPLDPRNEREVHAVNHEAFHSARQRLAVKLDEISLEEAEARLARIKQSVASASSTSSLQRTYMRDLKTYIQCKKEPSEFQRELQARLTEAESQC